MLGSTCRFWLFCLCLCAHTLYMTPPSATGVLPSPATPPCHPSTCHGPSCFSYLLSALPACLRAPLLFPTILPAIMPPILWDSYCVFFPITLQTLHHRPFSHACVLLPEPNLHILPVLWRGTWWCATPPQPSHGPSPYCACLCCVSYYLFIFYCVVSCQL